MESEHIAAAEAAADGIISCLARLAGVGYDDFILEVEEEYLESMDDAGNFAMETWVRFQAMGPDGQTYYAHLPGSLNSLIVRTVRDHSYGLLGE